MRNRTPKSREARMRVLEILRIEAGIAPVPRPPGREQRMRILDLLKIQAGIPLDDPAPRRPGCKGTPIDLTDLEREFARNEKRRQARFRTLRLLGLHEDAAGRTICLACGETLAAGAAGLRCASPWATGVWHRMRCPGRTT